MNWTPKTLGRKFDEVAKLYPDNEFIIYEDRRLTYKEVHKIVEELVRGLIALGVRRGDRVATYLGNVPEFIFSWLAVAKIGGILVAMNTRYKAAEVGHLLKH